MNRIGGHPALDFANTIDPRGVPNAVDELTSYAALAAWARAAGVIDARQERRVLALARKRPAPARNQLRRALELREIVFRTFTAVADGRSAKPDDVQALGGLAAAARRAQRLTGGPLGFAWQWCETAGLELPVLAFAEAAAHLLTLDAPLHARIRRCDGDPCGWLFLDTSKGGQRRWCSMASCGTIAKAANQAAKRA